MERNGGQVRRWVFLGTVVALTLTPWTWRNYRVHGCFVPVKNSFPKELWIGNNPYATGASVLADGRESVFQAVLPKYVQVTPAMTERGLMERLGSLARQHIREAPWSFARRTAAKVVWFWTTVPHRLTGTDSARNRFWVFQLCYWSVLVALWAHGWVMARGGPREYLTLLFVCGALYSIVYGLTFVDHSRFRAEIEFLFIPPAALCLTRILERAGLRRTGAGGPHGVPACQQRDDG
jgi:hypothetical protein